MRYMILALGLAYGCLSAVAGAGEAYKWTDKNGNVHYGEFAPGSGPSKTIETPSAPRPAEGDAASSDDPSLEKQKKALEGMSEDRIKKKEAKEKSEKDKQEATKRCNTAKGNLAIFEEGGRIQQAGPDGKLHVLTDAEIKTGLAEARKTVEKLCNK
jgi:hypothetical protein